MGAVGVVRPNRGERAVNDLPRIVEGFIAKKKFVILCTNALLLSKKIDDYKPSPYFTWSIHLDGDKQMHDHAVCQATIAPARSPRLLRIAPSANHAVAKAGANSTVRARMSAAPTRSPEATRSSADR